MLKPCKAVEYLSALDKVLKKWRREGVQLLSPRDEPAVIASLSKTGHKFSRDVVDLYCVTGGMEDADGALWALWPLERIISENAAYERPYILFADYLINSHLYCFKYVTEETSAVHVDFFDGNEPKRVAGTVAEFFELYLSDAEKLEIWDLPPRRI